jgi:hypothetical protein
MVYTIHPKHIKVNMPIYALLIWILGNWFVKFV